MLIFYIIKIIIRMVIKMKKNKVVNNERKSFGDTAILVFRLVSLIIIIVCLVVLYKWHKNNMQNNDIIDELVDLASLEDNSRDASDENIENINVEEFKLIVDFNELKSRNEDTVAWIKLNNTNIDFPVVKAENNSYYLKRNFKKESNGAGWIFADYRNTFDNLDKNTIIYGHNRRNGTMFSNLSNFLTDSWNFDNENSYFYFATESASYKAQIFSVYMMKATKLYIQNNFTDETEFQNYVQSLKELSINDFNVEVSNSDKIITLCTCDNTNQNRVVVHAKLIEQ